MPVLSDINLLCKYIEDSLKSTLKESVSKENNKILKETKQTEVYNKYNPSVMLYDRTYEFLNSNKSEIDEKMSSLHLFVLSTFTDTSSKAMPSNHPSWFDSSSNMNESIPYYMEYGNQSSFYAYKPRPYIEKAKEDIGKVLKKNLIKGLKKHGISSQ